MWGFVNFCASFPQTSPFVPNCVDDFCRKCTSSSRNCQKLHFLTKDSSFSFFYIRKNVFFCFRRWRVPSGVTPKGFPRKKTKISFAPNICPNSRATSSAAQKCKRTRRAIMVLPVRASQAEGKRNCVEHHARFSCRTESFAEYQRRSVFAQEARDQCCQHDTFF